MKKADNESYQMKCLPKRHEVVGKDFVYDKSSWVLCTRVSQDMKKQLGLATQYISIEVNVTSTNKNLQ